MLSQLGLPSYHAGERSAVATQLWDLFIYLGITSRTLRVLPATALERSHALRYGQVTHMHWICILAGSHRV